MKYFEKGKLVYVPAGTYCVADLDYLTRAKQHMQTKEPSLAIVLREGTLSDIRYNFLYVLKSKGAWYVPNKDVYDVEEKEL